MYIHKLRASTIGGFKLFRLNHEKLVKLGCHFSDDNPKKGRMMFAYIWEYFVKKGSEAEFERLYGPDGDWVQLFRKVDGYIATDLYRDITNSGRYVTTDFWRSKEARDRSRQNVAAEFAALDQRCELLTENEVFLGDFDCFSHHYS